MTQVGKINVNQELQEVKNTKTQAGKAYLLNQPIQDSVSFGNKEKEEGMSTSTKIALWATGIAAAAGAIYLAVRKGKTDEVADAAKKATKPAQEITQSNGATKPIQEATQSNNTTKQTTIEAKIKERQEQKIAELKAEGAEEIRFNKEHRIGRDNTKSAEDSATAMIAAWRKETPKTIKDEKGNITQRRHILNNGEEITINYTRTPEGKVTEKKIQSEKGSYLIKTDPETGKRISLTTTTPDKFQTTEYIYSYPNNGARKIAQKIVQTTNKKTKKTNKSITHYDTTSSAPRRYEEYHGEKLVAREKIDPKTGKKTVSFTYPQDGCKQVTTYFPYDSIEHGYKEKIKDQIRINTITGEERQIYKNGIMLDT